MSISKLSSNNRILIVDDNKSIHDDFIKVLCRGRARAEQEVNVLERTLFDTRVSAELILEEDDAACCELDHAYQGQQALELVEKAEAEGLPYALIFMDVRMPPGWDGIETILRIWDKHPRIEMVICTAFSDYSWEEIITKLGMTDRLLFLKKPFDAVAVKQIALALLKKWNLSNEACGHLKNLELEVSARTKQLQNLLNEVELQNIVVSKARDKANSVSKVKTDFMRAMSHEIRTPMNGVVGMASLLLDTDLTDDQFVFVDTIRKSCDQLMKIVNDTLDFSNFDSAKIELEFSEFSMRQCLEDIVENYSDSTFDKNIEIILAVNNNVPDILKADPGRIRQILCNLIDNAVKFTSSGEINIHCGILKQDDNQILIRYEVEDTGIGVEHDAVEGLFAPFSHCSGQTENTFTGPGLGLTISKQLVDLMQGEIGLKSEGKQGSCFWFEIPVKLGSGYSESKIEQAIGLKDRSILVIDNNKTTADVVSTMLLRWEANTHVLKSDQNVLEEMSRLGRDGELPEIVIIDTGVLQKDNLLLIRNIAERYSDEEVKVIIMAYNGARGDAKLFREYGAHAYLSKPVRERMLYKCMQLVIAGKGKERLLTRYHLTAKQKYYTARVLIVEDNIVNQQILKRILENRGCRVILAINGNEAVHAYKNFQFEMIFMDCMMPEKDGYEATRDIRRLESLTEKSVPIIAFTSNAFSDDRAKCMKAGMSDYIIKPAKAEEIDAVLLKWLDMDPEHEFESELNVKKKVG